MRRLIVLAAVASMMAVPVAAQDVAVRDSCGRNEAALVSINDTEGGHIGPGEDYGNKICVEGLESSRIRNTCDTEEVRLFSLTNETNGHYSSYDTYNVNVCAPNMQAELRNQCRDNETEAFSTLSDDNSHVASPGFSGYPESLCIWGTQTPRNVSLEVKAEGDEYFADSSSISTGETVSIASNPYIVSRDENGLMRGIINYGEFIETSRDGERLYLKQSGSGSYLLPFTEAETEDVDDLQTGLNERTFMQRLSPSVGFPSVGTPTIRVAYSPERNLDGFNQDFNSRAELAVRNSGLRENELFINIVPN